MKTNIPRRPKRAIDGGDWNALVNRRPGRLQLGATPGSREDSVSDLMSGLSVPYTIAEYDPVTGDLLRKVDRGKRRSQVIALRDNDCLFVTDADGNNWLYAVGTGHINRNSGVLVKWNADTGARKWDSDAGANTGPIFASSSNSEVSNRLVEASDGFIWVLGTDSTGMCLGRFDPDTGAQTHKIAFASASAGTLTSIMALPTGGQVLVNGATALSSKTQIIYDATASEVASLTIGVFGDYVINGSLIYAVHTATNDIVIYDLALSLQDSRAAPGAEVYGNLDTDGTTVWVTTGNGATPMIRAYDATNLATENWNAAQDAGVGTTERMIYANGALYAFPAPAGGDKVRKLSATTGAETWQSPSSGIRPTVGAVTRNACAVGSDFVMVLTGDANEQVFCLEDSDGTVRWYDEWSDDLWGCVVTPDDRVFVCGVRVGP